MTMASFDPAIGALMEQLGPEGYGIYWLLLEHVAIGIEKDSDAVPSRTHSVVEWAKICHCSTRRFRAFAQISTDLRLISAQTTAELRQFASRTLADRLQIDVPKLLKYRDEYSKKSGHAPEFVRRKAAEADTESRSSMKSPQEVALPDEAAATPAIHWPEKSQEEMTRYDPITAALNESGIRFRSALDVVELLALAEKQVPDITADVLSRFIRSKAKSRNVESVAFFRLAIPEDLRTWLARERSPKCANTGPHLRTFAEIAAANPELYGDV